MSITSAVVAPPGSTHPDAVEATRTGGPLVLYDGDCGLCNRAVHFLVDRDRDGVIHYAALQGDTGQQILRHFGMNTTDFDTFVVVRAGELSTRSTAALQLVPFLRWPWRFAALGWLVPRLLRDAVYGAVARNRMRFFGRGEAACRMPTPALRARMLD